MVQQPHREKDADILPDPALARDISLTEGGKEETFAIEDIKDIHEYGLNTQEEILNRYPLLRNKSEQELKALDTRIKKLIDWRMLPILTLGLLVNYLDRSNVTNARVAGMQRDLNMTDVEWSAGISLFYVGYMITQLPGCLLLSKYKPRIVMPLMICAWSLPTIMFPLVKNAPGFMMSRFAVGFAEGAFFPGIALMCSSWYVREELPFRMALWHGAPCLSNVFGGPIAAGILETMEGVAGLEAWKWFMIIEGIISFAVAGLAWWSLPNWANNTPWMTPEETEMAQYRIVLSAGGNDENTQKLSMWAGTKLALRDPFTWIFCAMHMALICAQSFKDFLPSILQTMSTSNLMTYLLQSPVYLCGFIAILVFGWTAGKYKENMWHIVVPLVISAAGTGMLIGTLNVGVRYTGACFLILGTASALNLHVSWETSLVPAPRHKASLVSCFFSKPVQPLLDMKAALIALANASSSTTHWWTPYFFLTNQKPLYRFGGGLILVSLVITILTCFVCGWYINRKNKQLDEAEAKDNEERLARGEDPLPKGWRFPK